MDLIIFGHDYIPLYAENAGITIIRSEEQCVQANIIGNNIGKYLEVCPNKTGHKVIYINIAEDLRLYDYEAKITGTSRRESLAKCMKYTSLITPNSNVLITSLSLSWILPILAAVKMNKLFQVLDFDDQTCELLEEARLLQYSDLLSCNNFISLVDSRKILHYIGTFQQTTITNKELLHNAKSSLTHTSLTDKPKFVHGSIISFVAQGSLDTPSYKLFCELAMANKSNQFFWLDRLSSNEYSSIDTQQSDCPPNVLIIDDTQSFNNPTIDLNILYSHQFMDPVAMNLPIIGFIGKDIYTNDLALKYFVEANVTQQYSYIKDLLINVVNQITSQDQACDPIYSKTHSELFYSKMMEHVIAE